VGDLLPFAVGMEGLPAVLTVASGSIGVAGAGVGTAVVVLLLLQPLLLPFRSLLWRLLLLLLSLQNLLS